MPSMLQHVSASSSLPTKPYKAKNHGSGNKRQAKLKCTKQFRFVESNSSVTPLSATFNKTAERAASVKKCVQFDLGSISTRQVPSLSDYSYMELFQLYYKQTDYDRFGRMYTEMESSADIAKKLPQRRNSDPERQRPKLASLITLRNQSL